MPRPAVRLLPVATPLAAALLLAVLPAAPLLAGQVAGRVFRDLNGNGRPDPGEDGAQATVELYGRPSSGGPIDLNAMVAPDGSFAVVDPRLGDGCYAVRVVPAEGFRLAPQRSDCGGGLPPPVLTRRHSSARHLLDALRAGNPVQVALGDSIAEPASLCAGFFPAFDATDYVGWLGDRLGCIAPGAVTENHAIGGLRTYHLLEPAGSCGPGNMPRIPNPDRCDNIYDTIARGPSLVTISIGGNDYLGSEPADQTEPFDPAEMQTAIDALIAARRNAQELLSVLATELPTTDVVVNTVYDNQAGACGSTDYHNQWAPIWNQMLRDVVWGQGERFHVAEIAPDYAHQDLNGANCCGPQGLICADGIHPTVDGAKIHLERVWDALGGVNLGSRDPAGQADATGLDFPVEELVAVRYPTVAEDRGVGAAAADAALARDGLGALAPAGDGELVLHGFDAFPAGISPSRVVVAVRYRTSQAPPAGGEADAYSFEAAVDGQFRAPAYSVTGWNTVVPLVGAADNAPAPNALPDVPRWREVRATLSKNLLDDGRARGSYDFPVAGWSDLSSLAVRLRGATRGAGRDPFAIEWDSAWVEVYGAVTPATALRLYRSPSPAGIVALANLVSAAPRMPHDDLPPPRPVFYYALGQDGAPAPLELKLVKLAGGMVQASWQ